jgi:hypothetical protein
MTRPSGELLTEVIDLSEYSLRELRKHQSDELRLMIQRVIRQVERPRANLGGTGPPGRAD